VLSDLCLTLDVLSRWQALILGEPVSLRTTDAYAKGGRERYPAIPELRATFERCLAQADDGALPLSVRGARLYLDVCFFHPFPDGNARAARLALDQLLARAGRTLLAVEPLFVPSWPAGETSFRSFAVALERLLA
jgi:hypothetical protein